VHVCPNAAPLVHAGRETLEITARVGDTIIVGDTVLMVAENERDPCLVAAARVVAGARLVRRHLVRALLSGPAADARALAALFTLNER